MNRAMLIGCASSLLFACGGGTPDGGLETEEVGSVTSGLHLQNVNISDQPGAQSELGIAVNPTNPLNLIAVSNNIADLSQLGVWFSTDGGVSWTANFINELEDEFGSNDSRFDPNVAFDSDGNGYVVYSISGTGNRVLLATTADGGQNFTPVTVVTTDPGTNNLHTPMVTTRADASGDDDVLVVYARVQGNESVEAALSLDGGANFTVTNTSINDALQRTFLPWAVADANGDFGVTWEVNEGGGAGVILYDTLDGTTLADGGNVTVTTIQITDFAEPTSKIPAQPARGLFSVTTVDTDRSTGRLFISYSDRPSTASDDLNIFLRFSDNDGATWSAPVQINDDGTTTSQFMPRMSVDQTSGAIFTVWYDARTDPSNNTLVDIFASASTDGGLTWAPNHQVTTAASNEARPDSDGNDYAEYIGLTAHAGVAHAAWTDARDANFVAGTAEDVFTARFALEDFEQAPVCVLGESSVSLRDRVVVSADLAGGTFFELGSSATLNGDGSVGGNTLIRSNGVVNGDLTLGGTLSTQGSFTVTGVLTENGSPAIPTLVTRTFSTGSGLTEVTGTVTLNPGNFGDVVIRPGANVTLNPGIYNLASLNVESDATVNVVGSVEINVQGNVQLGDRSSVTGGDLLVYLNGGLARIGADANFAGVLVAPNADVTVSSRTEVSGCIGGENVIIDTDTILNAAGRSLPTSAPATATCSDGIQNGDETGIDCGGSVCSACPTGTVSASLTVQSDWGAGYCALLAVTNEATLPTTTWVVNLNLQGSNVTGSWNGAFSGASGNISVGPGFDWNESIAPGTTNSTVGFCASRPAGAGIAVVTGTSGSF